jgi:predicted DNA-binding transcriptional regulator AlpA
VTLREEKRRAEQCARSFTLSEWCNHRRVSRSMFYKLLKLGLAPDSYLVGNSRYISSEADAAWLADRQAESKAAA